MIDNINSDNYVSNFSLYKPMKQQTVLAPSTTNPIDKNVMKGLEALGIYNMNLVQNKEAFNHKPAEIITDGGKNLSEIQGEKVTTPYGELEYIVKNDGKFETRYYPSEDKGKENIISTIEIRDVETGKLLKTQYNYDDYITIDEFPGNEPNVSYATDYRNGKISMITKIETLPNDLKKSYSKIFISKNPIYSVSMNDKDWDNGISVHLDSDCMVKDIDISRKIGNTDYNKSITLNKGAIIGVYENQNTTVPNFMERDVLNDTDVTPAKKFDKKQMEQLAKNNPDGNIYSFNGNGSIKEYFDGKTKVEFREDGTQIIKEYYSEDTTKTTTYDKDGSCDVYYRSGDLTKSLYITRKNKPEYYSVEQNGKCLKSVSFSEEGYLRYSE